MARPRKNPLPDSSSTQTSQSTAAASTAPAATKPAPETAAKAPVPTTSTTHSGGGWKFWVTTVLAAILLLVANSAYWVNHYIFDTGNFTQTATTALLTESSRNAIAAGVVDRALANRPVMKKLLEGPTVNLVSGLLGSSQAQAAANATVSRLHIALTSSSPQDISYDLTGVKTTVSKIVDIANLEGGDFDPNQLPDEIVILDADKIPNFYQYSLVFLWVAPIALFVGLGLLAWPYFRAPKHGWSIPLKQGLVIAGVGVFSLMLGPLFKPPVLAQVNTVNGRIVVENIYNAFGATFVHQTYLLLAISLAFGLVGGLWWLNDHRQLFQRGSSTKPPVTT